MREVSLYEMLDARERRAARQKELLARFGATLVSYTMNIAGPVKNSPLIREGFLLGKRLLSERLAACRFAILHEEETDAPTGNEAFIVVDAPARAVQRITCEIEDGTPVGRLLDLDVLAPDGTKAGRAELGLPERRCLICGAPAKGCARSRAHSVKELRATTERILHTAIDGADADDTARLAVRALLYEAAATPKPGLVDRANCGSHKDMDFFTFIDSACALRPYFGECSHIGRATASASPKETFSALRPAGRRAESAMFAATRGVNTHKGAVFSMGIMCAAMGRLPRAGWNAKRLCAECAAMASGVTAGDFAGITPENARTTGEKLYARYGITGVRGELEAGLPSVLRAALPVLKEGVSRGLSLNDAGCAALLAVIASSVDTNMIARGGIEAQRATSARVAALLAGEPFPDRGTLERLDAEFTAANLSPGGSADMLALAYLLYFVENEV